MPQQFKFLPKSILKQYTILKKKLQIIFRKKTNNKVKLRELKLKF